MIFTERKNRLTIFAVERANFICQGQVIKTAVSKYIKIKK